MPDTPLPNWFVASGATLTLAVFAETRSIIAMRIKVVFKYILDYIDSILFYLNGRIYILFNVIYQLNELMYTILHILETGLAAMSHIQLVS